MELKSKHFLMTEAKKKDRIDTIIFLKTKGLSFFIYFKFGPLTNPPMSKFLQEKMKAATHEFFLLNPFQVATTPPSMVSNQPHKISSENALKTTATIFLPPAISQVS